MKTKIQKNTGFLRQLPLQNSGHIENCPGRAPQRAMPTFFGLFGVTEL
jgi:hypothetical protein